MQVCRDVYTLIGLTAHLSTPGDIEQIIKELHGDWVALRQSCSSIDFDREACNLDSNEALIPLLKSRLAEAQARLAHLDSVWNERVLHQTDNNKSRMTL